MANFQEVDATFPDLRIEGEIVGGDAERLYRQLISHPVPLHIEINGPGGSIDEAIKMSLLIQGLRKKVSVTIDKSCLSACFFLFLAGEPREASSKDNFRSYAFGNVGLHRPYLAKEYFAKETAKQSSGAQAQLMKSVSTYLENQMVPPRLIELMMTRPSADIYWMTNEDYRALGQIAAPREEMFSARCNYDRRDWQLVLELTQKMRTVNDCMAGIQLPEGELFRQKLISGWLPWQKEKKEERRNWIKLVANNANSVFVDSLSRKKIGSVIRQWSLVSHKAPKQFGDEKIQSSASLDEIDCKNETITTIEDRWYSKAMGQGDVVHMSTEREPASPLPRDSALYVAACKK